MLNPAQRLTTEIVAVSIDDRPKIQLMLDRIVTEYGGAAPTYTFLSDPVHRVIDRYGLLNPDGKGWPHPTVYVIDKSGKVTWKFTEVNYKIRPTNEAVLTAVKALSSR